MTTDRHEIAVVSEIKDANRDRVTLIIACSTPGCIYGKVAGSPSSAIRRLVEDATQAHWRGARHWEAVVRPGTYARNNHGAYRPAPCPRCGGEPYVTWVETTQFGDPVPVDEPIGHRYCETPGCVDEHGSNTVPIGAEQ